MISARKATSRPRSRGITTTPLISPRMMSSGRTTQPPMTIVLFTSPTTTDSYTPYVDVPIAKAGKFIAHSSGTSRTRPSVTTPVKFLDLDAFASSPPNTAVVIPGGELITTT
eukprot:jgi/Phyca11/82350/gw1.11.878.1